MSRIYPCKKVAKCRKLGTFGIFGTFSGGQNLQLCDAPKVRRLLVLRMMLVEASQVRQRTLI